MADQGSVAPKERVNIVYKSATGDKSEEVELPLKLLVVGDYTGRPNDQVVEELEPKSINKDNFDEVLKSFKVGVDLSVPNKLEEGAGDELPVDQRDDAVGQCGRLARVVAGQDFPGGPFQGQHGPGVRPVGGDVGLFRVCHQLHVRCRHRRPDRPDRRSHGNHDAACRRAVGHRHGSGAGFFLCPFFDCGITGQRAHICAGGLPGYQQAGP